MEYVHLTIYKNTFNVILVIVCDYTRLIYVTPADICRHRNSYMSHLSNYYKRFFFFFFFIDFFIQVYKSNLKSGLPLRTCYCLFRMTTHVGMS